MKKLNKQLTQSLLSAVLLLTASGSPIPIAAVSAEEDSAGSIQAEFFVSPQGDDANDGSFEKPFATLQAAKEAVQKINDDMTGDIYVFLAGGDYYMENPLVLNEEDSGTNGYSVIYRNLDERGSASLIGGYQISSDWELVDGTQDPATNPDGDLPDSVQGKVYKTHVGTEHDFHTLYVNDKRATLARTQNRNNDSRFNSALTPYMRSAGGGLGDLYYQAGDLDEDSINGLVNAQKRGDLNASVYMWDGGYWDWMTDTIPVSAIEAGSRRLVYKTVEGHPEIYRPKYSTRNNARYFVQGNLGFLDEPGEYYFNSKTGDLYYYPEGSIEDQDIVIPTTQEIIRVEGSSREQKAENIEFSGLEIKDADHTEWYAYGWNWGDAGEGLGFYPEQAEGSTQPSYCEQTERIEFQYGNITLKNTSNISINNSRIKNSGMFGIELYLANDHVEIENCMIENTAHGGINVDGGYPGVAGDENGDGYSRDNMVNNCVIHDIGELVGQASGFTIQQSGYNTVKNVEIYNSPRRGIFLTAGYSRNGGTAYPNGDANYNPMTDLYTHHNSLEYIYLHDCQQDGGDDGAFFACYLYRGTSYKPNTVHQMLIDSIAANPSMTDIAPNGINLDMGASGVELHDVKVVNPQHFNLEVNTITQNNDQIVFDNTNIDFGHHTNHLDEFDDSRMEYDKIGITPDFPKEFLSETEAKQEAEDVYFSDDFENGLDYSRWSAKGTPEITTEWMSEGILAGRQALQINSDSGKPVLYRTFSEDLNKVFTVKMFDRAGFNICPYDSGININANITTYARADDGNTTVAMGIDNSVGGGAGVYTVQVGDTKSRTSIGRTYGWHELKWDYSDGETVKLYFDGQLVRELTEADGVSTSFNYVALGSERGSGITFFDEVMIYGGKPAADWEEGSLPEIPPYDSSDDNKEQLHLDFEDGQLPEFYHSTDDPDRLSQEIVTEDGNSYLKNYSGDGNAFYQTNASWNNYLVNLKWRFEGWGDKNVLDFGYDNFTIYVMTSSDGSTKQNNNPASYQVIYRRNKNGGKGFEAGTPYFEISKHTEASDISLGTAAVPEGFNEKEWHDFQVQTFDGKVGFVVDGTTILSADDGDYTSGGIGFGGINCTVDLDDIQIITNPVSSAELDLDFEDGQVPDFYHTTDDADRLTQEIAEEDGNHYLKHYSGDGHAFYQTGASWENYLVNLKWRFEGWGNKDVLGFAYDNFTIFVMADSDGSTKQNNNPLSYQVVYRRNINGGKGFAAGTPYFEICKHTDASDTSLGTAAVPEGFNEKEWHDFQVQTFDGKVGFVVDGVTLLSADDGQYTHGGIGFGGVNCTADIDDVQIITNPSYVTYDSHLGLTNIDINGEFNPNVYSYVVAVADPAKDVTFRMPQVTAANASISASINGEEITEMNRPVVLDLHNGNNTLVITEGSAAGDKVYTVTIRKVLGITSIDEPTPATTNTGTAPVLPGTAHVVFEDGSSQEAEISWKLISSVLYRTPGTFTAKGTLKEYGKEVSCEITVHGLESVEDLPAIETEKGTAPVFASSVTAHYSNEDKEATLHFAGLNPVLYSKAGTIIGVADAEGLDRPVLQKVTVKETEEPVETPANKTLLQQAVVQADALQESGELEGVNELVLAEFNEALAEARSVLENEKASQDEVNSAWIRLTRAIQMLGMKTDKTELRALIAQAEALNLDEYKEEGKQEFKDALVYAREVEADPAALSDVSIRAAVERLQNAMAALEKKAADLDLSILSLLVEEVEKADLSKYLSEGQDELKAALAAGKEVLATAENQQEVDSAVTALHSAWLKLRLKADESLLAQLKAASDTLHAVSLASLDEPMQLRVRNVMKSVDTVLEAPEASYQEASVVLDQAKTLIKDLNLPDLPEPDQKSSADEQTPAKQQKPADESVQKTEAEKKPDPGKQTASSVKTAAAFSWMQTSAAAIGSLALSTVLLHRRRNR